MLKRLVGVLMLGLGLSKSTRASTRTWSFSTATPRHRPRFETALLSWSAAMRLRAFRMRTRELRARQAGDPSGARGWYVPATREIVVLSDSGSRALIFRVLCHEVAHALLHPQGAHHSRPEMEVEAESVAFIVCHALGLETGDISFPYVAGWAHGEDAVEMVARSGQRILKAAQTLLSALAPANAEAAELAA